MRSTRNKTLDLPLDACREELKKCVFPTAALSEDETRDRVFCGDFFTVAPLLPEKSYGLAIVDPPYNLRKDYGGEVFQKRDRDAYAAFTRSWLSAVRRLLRDDGSLYVCCDWQSGVLIAPLLEEFFTVRSRITWAREKGRGAAKNWKNSMEDIWFCTNGEGYQFHLGAVKIRKKVLAPYRENGRAKDWQEADGEKFRMTCPSNFWDDITVPFWSMAENTAHPTQKPEKLYAKLLLASSSEGDLVFDPFGGSGTAAVVAKKLGRRYTVVEKNLQYCVWAQERLRRAETDKTIQGVKDGVFFERNGKG